MILCSRVRNALSRVSALPALFEGALACLCACGRPEGWAGVSCGYGVLATVFGTLFPGRFVSSEMPPDAGPGVTNTVPPPAALFVCRCPFFSHMCLLGGAGVGGEWAGASRHC